MGSTRGRFAARAQSRSDIAAKVRRKVGQTVACGYRTLTEHSFNVVGVKNIDFGDGELFESILCPAVEPASYDAVAQMGKAAGLLPRTWTL